MKQSNKNLYEVLGLNQNCDEDEIKKAFKKLAMLHHPDRGGDSEKFKDINEAYAILSDPQKRKNYDQFGSVDMADVQMPDINDLMENLFGGGGGFPFGGMMGGHMGRSQQKKSPPKYIDLEVTLEDVYNGATIKSKILKKVFKGNPASSKCKECKGQGHVVQQINMGFMITQNISQCSKCSGTGSFFSEKDFKNIHQEVEIPLPKGCLEGNKICLRNSGDEYPNMENGDLIFTIKYQPHSLFYTVESEIADLYCDFEITLYEFLFGFSRKFKFLNGEIFHIFQPSNIPLENVINKPIIKVIKNRGLSFKNHQGDLNVVFNIHLPTFNNNSIQLYQELLTKASYNIETQNEDEFTGKLFKTINIQNL